MITARECFLNAAECEQMAKDAEIEALRTFLLRTARHWRKMGDIIEVDETRSGCPSDD